MGRSDFKRGQLDFKFMPIPSGLWGNEQFRTLPPMAYKMLLAIAHQYNGRNNGRLTTSFEVMKRYGFNSKSTVASAKRALLDTGFVILTRRGHPPSTTDWVGLTWHHLNHNSSMDIGPTGWPYRNFECQELVRIDPNKGRHRPKEKRLQSPGICTNTPGQTASGAPESGQIDSPLCHSSVQKSGDSTEADAEKSIGPEIGDVLELPSVGRSGAPAAAPLASSASTVAA